MVWHKVVACSASVFLLAGLSGPPAVRAQGPNERLGWTVIGYDEKGLEIGRQETGSDGRPLSRTEAMREKARMEQLEGTNGKIYAFVNLVPPAVNQSSTPAGPRVWEPVPNRPSVTNQPTPQPTPRPPRLIGSSFSGSEDLNGYGKLTFHFVDAKHVTMYDARNTVQGRWEPGGGNTVYLYFYNDQCVYRGTLTGNTLSGTARSANALWSWKTTLR
jgi:hypothetical protein